MKPTVVDRTLADAVKLLHVASGMTFAALEQRSNVSAPHIHQVENGKKKPSAPVVRSLDQALGAGGLLSALHAEDDPVRRRALLAVISTMATGGHEYLRLLDGIAAPQAANVGSSDVEAVGQAIDFCTSLDLRYGGSAAVGPGRAMLSWAIRLLHAQMGDDVRQRLYSNVSALADRVAWANYDAGNDQASARLYGIALRVAREGHDANLVAHVLIDASTRESHNGEHGKAVDLLRTALDGDGLLPSVRANVGLTLARHVGNAGDSRRALDEIERSFEAAARFEPGQVPEWSKGFLANPGHLMSVAARSYLFAGQYDKAISGFSQALTGLTEERGRGRAYALCLQGIAYFRGGYVDMCEQVAGRAITAAGGLKSARVSGHLSTLAGHFAAAGLRDGARNLKVASREVSPTA